MQAKLAIYGGSFDPITKGHVSIIEQAAEIFPQLEVTVGVNPAKLGLFLIQERVDMIVFSTSHLPNVTVTSFYDEYLVNYALSRGARHVIRGLRDTEDFRVESGMKNLNRGIEPSVRTVFLMPPQELADVSSSAIKGFVGPKGWEVVVQKYVPEIVLKKLKEKHDARRSQG